MDNASKVCRCTFLREQQHQCRAILFRSVDGSLQYGCVVGYVEVATRSHPIDFLRLRLVLGSSSSSLVCSTGGNLAAADGDGFLRFGASLASIGRHVVSAWSPCAWTDLTNLSALIDLVVTTMGATGLKDIINDHVWLCTTSDASRTFFARESTVVLVTVADR